MAMELRKVNPGELIRSDLMNLIIDKLLELNSKLTGVGETGGVIVPSLFGKTLLEATTVIKQPQINLQLNTVIDAFGTPMDPSVADAKTRLVINQIPNPGARVTAGTPIDFVIAARPAAGGTVIPPVDKSPQITGFNPLSTPIKQPVTIVGKNFDTNPTLNTKVFFDGEDAGAPSPQSTDIFLVVTVPAIPNPPTAGEKEVTVKVQTPLGETTAKYRVTPALAGENPKINSIKTVNAGVAIVNELISIQGDFFDPTPAKNRVSFEGQNTEVAPEVQGSSKTALSVRIPSLPALTGAGALPVVGVNIVVKSKDAEGKDRLSNAVPLTIAK